MFFATTRVDAPTSPRAAEIDAILADEMLDADLTDDPVRDYAERVDMFLNDPTALNVRKAVAA